MRKLALLLLIAACGKDPGMGDDTMTPDGATGSNDPNADVRAQEPGHPDPSGQEITKCYYFHTPNTRDRGGEQVDLRHDAGQPPHDHVPHAAGSNQPADGTIDENCGGGGGGRTSRCGRTRRRPRTTRSTCRDDDGTGKPLAQDIPPNTAGYFQMHYLNATDSRSDGARRRSTRTPSMRRRPTRRPTRTSRTTTTSASRRRDRISVTGSCNVPDAGGAKYWMVSTHTHKQGVDTKIKDGASMVFDSTDWEHPGAEGLTRRRRSTRSRRTSSTGPCTYDNANAGHDDPRPARARRPTRCAWRPATTSRPTAPKFNVVIGNGGGCSSIP